MVLRGTITIEWLEATIGNNGFPMVFGSCNHWQRWFSMAVHHWSDDGMVKYHRTGLSRSLTAVAYSNVKSFQITEEEKTKQRLNSRTYGKYLGFSTLAASGVLWASWGDADPLGLSKGLIGFTSSRFGRPSFSMWSFSRAMFWLGGRSTHCIGRIKQDLLLFLCLGGNWESWTPAVPFFLPPPWRKLLLLSSRASWPISPQNRRAHKISKSSLDSSSRTKAAKDSIYFSPQDFGFLTNSLNSKSENFPLITSHVTADAPKNAPAAKMT